ncbi:MAG: DUF3179 domain-containing protein [Pseudomonadota bacterium]
MRFVFLACAIALAPFTALAQASVDAAPQFWSTEWGETDFSRNTLKSWTEVISGGPPKDGIPSIENPQFVSVADESALGDREPVITLEIDGEVPRAYPIRYLTWHEIVNDTVGDVPVAVTFCPLCNSGITFDRRVQGQVLEFGVSGKLRNSDMIMYDRETQSWWQQAVGQGIVGEMVGVQLTKLPTWMESWAEFKERNPEGAVMAQPTGFARPYGQNPYVRYDSSQRPFLFNGEMPPHDIPPLVRVVRVGDKAWPLTRLSELEEVTEAGVRLTWRAGQASALDGRDIATSRDVGTVRVFDAATGENLPHDVMFAFAFHAFWPDGTWMLGS